MRCGELSTHFNSFFFISGGIAKQIEKDLNCGCFFFITQTLLIEYTPAVHYCMHVALLPLCSCKIQNICIYTLERFPKDFLEVNVH